MGLFYGSSSWFDVGFLFDFDGSASVDFVILGCLAWVFGVI